MFQGQQENVQVPVSPMKKNKTLSENVTIPVSPLKKLKILSENQAVHVEPTVPEEPVQQHQQESDEVELLLKESVDQYVIFPIKYDDIWTMYKKLVDNFWCSTDNLEHLESLQFNDKDLEYLKYLTGFFALFDLQQNGGGGLLNENFAEEFSRLVQVTEAKFFYGHLLFVQNLHFEMFNKLHEVVITTDTDREILREFEIREAVLAKRELLNSWYRNDLSFGEKLVASACLHGILFTSLNLTEQWINKRLNVKANHELVENIHRLNFDQDLARDFACLMVSYVRNKPTEQFLFKTIEESVRIEREFLTKALPIHLIGFTERDVNMLLDKRSNLLKIKLLQAFNGNKAASEQRKDTTARAYATATAVTTMVNDQKTAQIKQHQKTVFDEDF